MKSLILLIVIVILSACDSTVTTCDQYVYSGTLDEHGELFLDSILIDMDDPFVMQGWAEIDHGDFETWEPLAVEINDDQIVHIFSHGGSNARYRLTLIDCVRD